MKALLWFLIPLVLGAPLACPQDAAAGKKRPPRALANRQEDTVGFLWAEMANPGVVVKGKPFSAEALTETSQTLSDGNRISRRTQVRLYRDSEGRTRRDGQLGSLGLWTAGAAPAREFSLLQDPVAGIGYTLNSHARTARKYPLRRGATPGNAAPAARPPAGKQGYEITREPLGRQIIEGIEARGVRTRTTIPAGQAGNTRPIEATYERWYSADLQAVVLFRYADPRFGESEFRLTNIRRGEPDPSLFAPPPDYTISEKPPARAPATLPGRGDKR